MEEKRIAHSFYIESTPVSKETGVSFMTTYYILCLLKLLNIQK